MLQNQVRTGRRSASRLRVRLAVRAVTRKGSWPVVLNDLSQSGARIEPHPQIALGEEVLLQWARHEAFGVVVRDTARGVGISFYDPIEPAALIATRIHDEKDHLPDEQELRRRAARNFVTGRK